MAGPAGCSDRVGDSVRSNRGEQSEQREDDVDGCERRRGVELGRKHVESQESREQLWLPGSACGTWGRKAEPQPPVWLWHHYW